MKKILLASIIFSGTAHAWVYHYIPPVVSAISLLRPRQQITQQTVVYNQPTPVVTTYTLPPIIYNQPTPVVYSQPVSKPVAIQPQPVYNTPVQSTKIPEYLEECVSLTHSIEMCQSLGKD